MTEEKRWERGNERDIGSDRQASDTAGMALKKGTACSEQKELTGFPV